SPACLLTLGAKGLAHLSPEAAPKAGSCPWVNNQISQLCQEEDECSRDSECYGNKKCCMSNCRARLACVRPGFDPQHHIPTKMLCPPRTKK
uniref:WAP domain-containing protein n=1 Tax=Urocitellus parryii TaxID=9999 RepID=A0A8D2IHS4_UROPR